MPWEICFTFNGRRHCVPVPVLFDRPFPPIPPENLPELELAVTVEELAQHIQVVLPDSKLTRQLTETSRLFIEETQRSLPKGVELSQVGQRTVGLSS